jgi:hypothetical protein
MTEVRRAWLVFHGALVLVLGMAAGFGFATAIGDEAGVRAWRMAHLEGVLNGLVLIGAGAAGSLLRLGDGAQRLLVWSLAITAWANTVASVIAASAGVRGLQPGGPLANNVVFVLFLVAVVTVFVGLFCLAIGAWQRARGGS